MGIFSSKRTTITAYSADLPNLTPVAETTQAQIYCRSDALEPNGIVPDSERYVIRPKSGLCIQAKPRNFNGKLYYVVGMVRYRQGRKTNQYINMKLEGVTAIPDVSIQQVKTEELVVPNTTVVGKLANETMTMSLEQLAGSSPESKEAPYEETPPILSVSASAQRILTEAPSVALLPSPAEPIEPAKEELAQSAGNRGQTEALDMET